MATSLKKTVCFSVVVLQARSSRRQGPASVRFQSSLPRGPGGLPGSRSPLRETRMSSSSPLSVRDEILPCHETTESQFCDLDVLYRHAGKIGDRNLFIVLASWLFAVDEFAQLYEILDLDPSLLQRIGGIAELCALLPAIHRADRGSGEQLRVELLLASAIRSHGRNVRTAVHIRRSQKPLA
jgi:hypothetical protein